MQTYQSIKDETKEEKRGDKSECDNYRPISLISNISKLIEKTVHGRLYFFLEKEQHYLKGSLDLGTTDQ